MPAKKASSPKRKASPKKTKSPKAKRATKVKKEGPKRPTSAFMYYSQERRKQIVAQDPSLRTNIGGVAKRIGEEWRGLTASAKTKYESLAAKDRQRYESEKKKFE